VRTIGIDINAGLIARLNAGETPYVEPGLAELLKEAAPAITYTTDALAAADTEASIILVPTPSTPEAPEFSINDVAKACGDLASALRTRTRPRYHLIIISSTVAPGAIGNRITTLLEDALGQRAGRDFGIAYVPDFVALGDIVKGFKQTPFLLVGSDDATATAKTVALYRRIVAPNAHLCLLSTLDAEITKVAHNVYCCMKVSFGNFLAQLSDRFGGADLDAIAATLGHAPNVQSGYLRAGGPFGGPCLPRDTIAFMHLANSLGLEAPFARAAEAINAAQYDLIERHLLASKPRSVAMLGLSFKPGTPVTIASPAFEFVTRLLRRSVKVFTYDPMTEARKQARAAFGAAITCCETLAEALAAADAVLICNPDPSFTGLGRNAPPDRPIIDPWGCIKDPHPGLVRPGRLPLGAKLAAASIDPAPVPAEAR
jgi:UDPglucose 6-dehydrogenase